MVKSEKPQTIVLLNDWMVFVYNGYGEYYGMQAPAKNGRCL